ncbi:hypothetical protein A0H81_08580 [Grifola frondosa]|uniref:Uncharacterized protein n=1 Tax=Grifola frondosa TaxID=5627 RepID=A0A1C7M5A7_GRIFR|nr:hypothetical protein A0H81_08580 [Grifola frondosa]
MIPTTLRNKLAAQLPTSTRTISPERNSAGERAEDGNAPRHEAFTDQRRSMGIVTIPKDASSSSPSPGSRHSDRDTGGPTLFSSKHAMATVGASGLHPTSVISLQTTILLPRIFLLP